MSDEENRNGFCVSFKHVETDASDELEKRGLLVGTEYWEVIGVSLDIQLICVDESIAEWYPFRRLSKVADGNAQVFPVDSVVAV